MKNNNLNRFGVTTSLVLDRRKPIKNPDEKADPVYPVKLRITFQRISRLYKTPHQYTEDHFLQIMDPTVRTYKKTRAEFVKIEERAEEIFSKMKVFTFEDFRKKYESETKYSKDGVLQKIDDVSKDLESQNRIETARIYNGLHKSLTGFGAKSRLTFIQITPGYLKRFENWMTDQGKGQTTIGIYMRHLRRIFNIAIEEGIINKEHYPFGEGANLYKIPEPRNIKRALRIDDIKKIMEYSPEPSGPEMYYRDLWIFSYLCNGMNVKDICHLKRDNIHGDKISFKRKKTINTDRSSKNIEIAIIPEVKEILNKWGTGEYYVFPILKKDMTAKDAQKRVKTITKSINKYIKLIAKEVEIEQNVSTYTARHTFATVLKRSGIGIEYISDALGHKNVLTTESYLGSFEFEDIKKIAQNLIPK